MNDCMVHTPYGTLVGRCTERGAQFLGVSYAEPPVGERRFLPPVPRRHSERVVDARQPGADPPQIVQPVPGMTDQRVLTDEDCLHLNVYTPALDGVRRPVLVHVFGGGFQNGSASTGFQD